MKFSHSLGKRDWSWKWESAYQKEKVGILTFLNFQNTYSPIPAEWLLLRTEYLRLYKTFSWFWCNWKLKNLVFKNKVDTSNFFISLGSCCFLILVISEKVAIFVFVQEFFWRWQISSTSFYSWILDKFKFTF